MKPTNGLSKRLGLVGFSEAPRSRRAIVYGILLLSHLLIANPALFSQDKFDKDAFLSRKKWYASFTLLLAGNGTATRTDSSDQWTTTWDIHHEVTGSFVLDHVGQSGPRKSVLEKGERYQGRYISWDASEGWSPVAFLVADRVSHKSVTYGEHHAATNVSGFSKLNGGGSTRIGRFKSLNCDLKDMDFDFVVSSLKDITSEPPAKPLKYTGEYHDDTPITRLRNDIVYPLAEYDIRFVLPEVVPLEDQLVSRKLALVKGKIVFTVSMPINDLPRFPNHPGSNPGVPEALENGKIVDGPPLVLSLEVTLSPTPPSKAKLLLKPRDYDKWRPLCSDSESKPGNQFALDWRVEEEGGDPAKPAKVSRLVFELLNTTKLPGVCMNYPLRPKLPADFDLKFATLKSPVSGYEVTSEGQKLKLSDARVSAGKGEIAVDCFDSGATAALVAEAELEDGRVLKAVVEKTGESQVLIPDYEPGVSMTARGWRDKHAPGKLDDDDDENDPVGDGQKGDGFTVWEEYRGFWVGGVWDGDCDPKKKDLFIFNGVGDAAQGGIWLFRGITDLLIHDQLAQGEIKADRVMNFNHEMRPHLVDQHCIAVTEGGFETKNENGSVTAGSICNPVDGASFPGPPKNTFDVSIRADMLAMNSLQDQVRSGETYKADVADSTVAHELGHALGIRHHGDKDTDPELWTWVRKDTGELVISANGVPITVRYEKTGDVMYPSDLFPAGKTAMFMRIGERNGQHSGDEACVMRYDVAQAYRSQSYKNVIYYHGILEIIGNRLCRSPAGTGVNMPTHAPQSRYFGADQGRGDCVHKFVVSDRWEKIH